MNSNFDGLTPNSGNDSALSSPTTSAPAPSANRSAGVALRDVHVRYGRFEAIRGISANLRPGVITGLLGRNGSGKSTLARAIAAQHPFTGEITLGAEQIWENPQVMPQVALVSDATPLFSSAKVSTSLDLWEDVRPTFNRQLADGLLEAWEIPTDKRPNQLSRGQQSAVSAALGIASRAPLTIFDEVHLGMDAVLRRDFYDVLLQDFIAHPRAIVISSHNVEEIEHLIEDVWIIENGQLAASGTADDVRASFAGVAVSREAGVPDLTSILAHITQRISGTNVLKRIDANGATGVDGTPTNTGEEA
ncbi:ABC-2 type transport system ATP-binding protein [Arcanobacterium wilhelmae]|uniref:ABC-2 type transport system ATP-binding protein n=1 Tax=Arcanobacterium wilhelmae TaxID=1803177 RepID=A0ABT9NB65_9ACTO|nr:ABC transporter ATP-binding protein [Arcanobacterium wilhelmae]MDP9800960.1 ABC-2 type transport system ATP-binding protein [Arcanobacterium wilhelmae]WFN90320.1 ABC transporter ATP-binding protein [Arcanobacterium wilhelmae]